MTTTKAYKERVWKGKAQRFRPNQPFRHGQPFRPPDRRHNRRILPVQPISAPRLPLQPVSASRLQSQPLNTIVFPKQRNNKKKKNKWYVKKKKDAKGKKPRITKLLRILAGPGLRFEHPTCYNHNRDRIFLSHFRWDRFTTKAEFERAILVLLFEARVLIDWTVTDNLVDVFAGICDKMMESQTADWPVNMTGTDTVQLFHAVMRSRLDWLKSPVALVNGQEPCAVAVRVDKLVKWMGGVDDLMEELETFINIAVPTAQALKKTMSKSEKRAARVAEFEE